MICEFCGGETQKKKVKRQHWLQGQLYIVENVEAEVCKECGERRAIALCIFPNIYQLVVKSGHTALADQYQVRSMLYVDIARLPWWRAVLSCHYP
jgi:YgiT-type zinc finger domain-containing protein